MDEDDAAPHHHIRRRVSLGVEAGGCLLRFAPQALRHASGEPPASSMVCRPALGLPKPAAEVLRRLQRRLGAIGDSDQRPFDRRVSPGDHLAPDLRYCLAPHERIRGLVAVRADEAQLLTGLASAPGAGRVSQRETPHRQALPPLPVARAPAAFRFGWRTCQGGCGLHTRRPPPDVERDPYAGSINQPPAFTRGGPMNRRSRACWPTNAPVAPGASSVEPTREQAS